MYSSVVSVCLTQCVCGLLSVGCSVIVPLVSVVCPLVVSLAQGACVGFLLGGTVVCTLVYGLGLFPLVGRAMSSCVLWGVCEFSRTLAILSADAWGCVLVLLVVYPEASSTGACRLLDGAGSLC